MSVTGMQRALILAAVAAAPITARHAAPTVTSAPLVHPISVAQPTKIKAEKIEIRTSDGLLLSGSFFEPKKRSPAAVLVHNAGADREELNDIAEKLYKQGFGVLTFDVRGHGMSKGPKADWSTLGDEDERKTLWAQGMRDVQAAADWILGQKSIHSTSLSLVGHGSGCALVARHAKEDENVISLTLLAPREEDMGFDVRSDLEYLNGLPTFVVTPRKSAAEEMVQQANALAGDHPYIELFLATSKAETVLDDRKVPGKVSSWMKDIVRPKKGR